MPQFILTNSMHAEIKLTDNACPQLTTPLQPPAKVIRKHRKAKSEVVSIHPINKPILHSNLSANKKPKLKPKNKTPEKKPLTF